MVSSLIEIRRKAGADKNPFEVKDPSIVRMPDGSFMMYATFFGSAIPRYDIITRFHAEKLDGPWQELGPVSIHGLKGPEICAPQILLNIKNGQPLWTMYVQTACFSVGGVIAVATSSNGSDFYALPKPVASKETISARQKPPIVGVYDVSVSSVTVKGKPYECMVFSGYRRLGCGDIFMSLRKEGGKKWSVPKCVLKQESVPFHNHPDSPNFEWGLEGAKIMQIAGDCFLMAGVCFLEKPAASKGTRQRIFFAASRSPDGPFVPMNTPVEPTRYDIGQGENGHPDMIDLGDRLGMVYQERAGDKLPWHLRYVEYRKDELRNILESYLHPAGDLRSTSSPGPA